MIPSRPIMFEVKVTAVGEVRDKDGNLISSEPIEVTTQMSQAELEQSGLSDHKEQ